MSDNFKLSVSKTATFNSCKKKYNFCYIQRLPRKEWSFHTFGKFAHRVLELFHLAYIEGSKKSLDQQMSEAFNTALNEKEFLGKITSETNDAVFAIMKTYLEKVKNPLMKTKILSVEKTFNCQINDNLILTGMIDRIQLDADGIYHVLDYKTTKSKAYLKDDVLQLLTYAYVVFLENPTLKKVRVSYVMLRHDCEFITKEFSLDEILAIKEKYEFAHEQIMQEKEWAPNTSKLCSYCDYSEFCPEGKKVIQQSFKYGAIK